MLSPFDNNSSTRTSAAVRPKAVAQAWNGRPDAWLAGVTKTAAAALGSICPRGVPDLIGSTWANAARPSKNGVNTTSAASGCLPAPFSTANKDAFRASAESPARAVRERPSERIAGREQFSRRMVAMDDIAGIVDEHDRRQQRVEGSRCQFLHLDEVGDCDGL